MIVGTAHFVQRRKQLGLRTAEPQHAVYEASWQTQRSARARAITRQSLISRAYFNGTTETVLIRVIHTCRETITPGEQLRPPATVCGDTARPRAVDRCWSRTGRR